MIKTLVLPRHIGKTEHLLLKLEELHIEKRGVSVSLIVHALGREEVRGQNLARLAVKSFGRPFQLRAVAGKCLFSVLGYQNDEEELYLIPEVRRYFQLVSSREAHWLFTCRLSSPCTLMILLCCLESFTTARSGENVCVSFDSKRIGRLIDEWMPLCRKLQSFSRARSLPMRRELRAFQRALGVL